MTLGGIFLAKGSMTFWFLLASALGFGFIGFVDDYIKIVKHRSLGLTPWQKIAMQLVISTGLAYAAVKVLHISTQLIIPATSIVFDLGWLYIPFVMFLLIGTTNAVNLTDGLDGTGLRRNFNRRNGLWLDRLYQQFLLGDAFRGGSRGQSA